MKVLPWLAATALCAIGSAAQAQTPTAAALQQCLADEAKSSGFSGVISIVQPGGAVTHQQGLMGGEGSARMLPDAQFNIGSAGKMWTAVAVAQLVDAGKISLDDPVGRYVTGLSTDAAAVTIRQLLTHSSGLGNFFTPDNLGLFQHARSLAELKPLIVGDKPAFAPGSKSQYSNTGFLLLGLLIEQVSGRTYGEYLAEHLFKPAGMTGSSVMPAEPARRAIGMTNLPEGPPAGPPGPMRPPPGPLRPAVEAELMGTSAGGSFSTPSDMQRFFAALVAAKLTSPAMLKALTSQQFEILPARGPLPAVHYGLGFALGEYGGRSWIGHNGGSPGVNVATAAFAAEGTVVVVLVNRDPPAADMMLRKVQAMLFDSGACKA